MRSSVRSRLASPYFQRLTGAAKPNPVTLCHTPKKTASGVSPSLRTQQEKTSAAPSVTPRDPRDRGGFGSRSRVDTVNHSPTSEPALQVVQMVRASAVFRWMIEQDSYLLTLLISAAEAAAKRSDLERFFEVLAYAICTSERGVEIARKGSP